MANTSLYASSFIGYTGEARIQRKKTQSVFISNLVPSCHSFVCVRQKIGYESEMKRALSPALTRE